MNELAVLCLQHGLERLLPYLPLLARPSIRLLETEEMGNAGVSRLGGLPDVLPHFRWPRLRDCRGVPEGAQDTDLDVPLMFLGQLNWAQLKPFDLENVLPPTGGALFFTGQGEGANHYFVATVNQFAQRHFPLPEELKHVLSRRVLQPHFEWTLPNYGYHGTIGGGDFQQCFFDTVSPAIEFLELSDAERKAYKGLKAQAGQPGAHRHRVLGHADYEQNPLQLDLERRTRGLLLDRETYLTLCDPTAPLTHQLKRQTFESQWRLAFQIGHFISEEGLWEDGGTYYFWSKRKDLVASLPRFIGDVQFG